VSGVGHLFIKAALLSCAGHPNLIYVTIVYKCVPVGWQLVEELKGDEALRKALSDELLVEALSRKEWRRAALLAVLKEAVTKDDMRELRAYMDTRIDGLGRRIDDLARGIEGVNSYVQSSLIVIAVTLAATIAVPFIIRLLLGA
jgi:hypothetical protein